MTKTKRTYEEQATSCVCRMHDDNAHEDDNSSDRNKNNNNS